MKDMEPLVVVARAIAEGGYAACSKGNPDAVLAQFDKEYKLP